MDNLTTWLHLAQLLALVYASIFFLGKLFQGWLLVNLSVSGTTERRARAGANDDLSVALTLTKGGNGSLKIADAVVRVSWGGSSRETVSLNTTRLVTSKRDHKLGTVWTEMTTRTQYRMPPGDTTTLSCHFQVPHDQVCTVKAVIVGRQELNYHPGQWHCCLVSLPLEGAESEHP